MTDYKLHELQPTNSIRFYNGGNAEPRNEVMRISREGVWANPDIPVDEAAQLVLKAVDGYVKTMAAQAVNEETQRCVDVLMAEHERVKNSHNSFHYAANLIRGNT